MRILTVCTSCKTLCIVLSHSHWGLGQFFGGGEGRKSVEIGGGGVGVVKKKESPDFRSPEVDISVEVWATYQLFTEVEVARGDIYNCREAAR